MLSDDFLVEIAKSKEPGAPVGDCRTRADQRIRHRRAGRSRRPRRGAQGRGQQAARALSRFGHTTVARNARRTTRTWPSCSSSAPTFRPTCSSNWSKRLPRRCARSCLPRRRRKCATAHHQNGGGCVQASRAHRGVAQSAARRPGARFAGEGRSGTAQDPAVAAGPRPANPRKRSEAFATLCGVSGQMMKNLVRQQSDETVVILGKAVGLGWPDLKGISDADDERTSWPRPIGPRRCSVHSPA